MRRSLYFVLMVVLVLRGLTGTAMAAGILPTLPATGAAHHQALAAEEHGGGHHGAHADMALPEDGPAHAAGCDAASTTGCAAHEHHASTCSACEICHSAMLDAPPAPAQAPVLATGAGLPAASARFESALPAPAIKPPIA